MPPPDHRVGRLDREHGRPHHRDAGGHRQLLGEPVGHLVGRGVCLRHHRRRPRRPCGRRPLGRHPRDQHPHRDPPPPRRRQGARAQPPLLRDAARHPRGGAAAAAPELRRVRGRHRDGRRVLGCRELDRGGRGVRRAGRRRVGGAAAQPRCDHRRADRRRGGVEVGAVRAHVPHDLRRARSASDTHASSTLRSSARSRSSCTRTARSTTGTARAVGSSPRSPTSSTDRGDQLSGRGARSGPRSGLRTAGA